MNFLERMQPLGLLVLRLVLGRDHDRARLSLRFLAECIIIWKRCAAFTCLVGWHISQRVAVRRRHSAGRWLPHALCRPVHLYHHAGRHLRSAPEERLPGPGKLSVPVGAGGDRVLADLHRRGADLDRWAARQGAVDRSFIQAVRSASSARSRCGVLAMTARRFSFVSGHGFSRAASHL